MKPEALFLDSDRDAGFPVRAGCKVTPLIESAAMYPKLEEQMLLAENYVWLAFRIFDLSTKLRSKAAKSEGLSDWADLIRHTAMRGVEVRLLLADFEPVLGERLHAGTWSTYRQIEAIRPKLEESEQHLLQLIVVPHIGEFGWFWRQMVRFAMRGKIRRLIDHLFKRSKEDEHVFDIRPGLWRWLHWEDGYPKRWKPGPPSKLRPATYHQKNAIVDGKITFIGGLDLDERRWDDPNHKRPANQTWHDLSAIVEGPMVEDAARNFAELWNDELSRFQDMIDRWTNEETPDITSGPLDRVDVPKPTIEHAEGEASTQLLRTRSRASVSPFAVGPKPDIRELEAAHGKIIKAARKRLYIEAQFFRSKKAADWVIEALRDNAELEVIILVANVPEEIAFMGEGNNPAHRHGEYLQAKALSRIFAAGGTDRVGLFTLARDERADGEEEEYSEQRGTAFGSGVIHIHAKLLIADNDACLISSANINGRSFQWDTELGFLWFQENGAIASFRNDLWARLSRDALKGDACLEDWRHLAEHNRLAEPDERQGFVVPYQRGRARRFGKPHFYVPDSFV